MLDNLFSSKSRGGDKNVPSNYALHWRKIVIPALGAPYSLRAVHSAAHIASACCNVDVRLIYIMEVPRAYSLRSPMPAEEAQAQTVLADALEEARRGLMVPTCDVLRVRDPIEGLIKYVEQLDDCLLVLGGRPDQLRGLPHEFCHKVVERAQCEVMYNYIASEQ